MARHIKSAAEDRSTRFVPRGARPARARAYSHAHHVEEPGRSSRPTRTRWGPSCGERFESSSGYRRAACAPRSRQAPTSDGRSASVRPAPSDGTGRPRPTASGAVPPIVRPKTSTPRAWNRGVLVLRRRASRPCWCFALHKTTEHHDPRRRSPTHPRPTPPTTPHPPPRRPWSPSRRASTHRRRTTCLRAARSPATHNLHGRPPHAGATATGLATHPPPSSTVTPPATASTRYGILE